MTATLLIDLDNTLLQNDVNLFIPRFMAAFAEFVSERIDPQLFQRLLLRGTRAMISNRRPDCTLLEAFEADVFKDLPVDAEAFYQLTERFYAQEFPKLRSLTQPIPEAIAMMDAAAASGLRLALTTNPLFPRSAILQRLEWAGLPAERYPFEVIASYEKFHAAKPDPAFYAETLAYLGWPAGPVVVVGDDPLRDITAGSALGLATYWVAVNGQDLPAGNPQPTGRGSLSGLLPWLESTSTADLEPDYAQVEALQAVLRSTPAALDGLWRDTPLPLWTRRPAADEWSMTEIACHLRDVENEVNLPRMRLLMDTGNPFMAGQDTDRWAETREYIRQDGPRALAVFARQRMELAGLLEALQPDDWQLPARHAIFGPTQLIELVGIMAAHDRLHVQQARAALTLLG